MKVLFGKRHVAERWSQRRQIWYNPKIATKLGRKGKVFEVCLCAVMVLVTSATGWETKWLEERQRGVQQAVRSCSGRSDFSPQLPPAM